MMPAALRWEEPRIVIRSTLILLLVLASSASAQPVTAVTSPSSQEIIYSSTDLRHIFVFAQDGFRVGYPLDYEPGHPPAAIRYISREDGVQCVSIGVTGSSMEYAVKRPLRRGERFRCERTSFRVVRCYFECSAAIIAYDTRPAANLGPEGYLYVHNCLGILVFSQTSDLAKGIPLSASVLRGRVGILADPNYPNCPAFEW